MEFKEVDILNILGFTFKLVITLVDSQYYPNIIYNLQFILTQNNPNKY